MTKAGNVKGLEGHPTSRRNGASNRILSFRATRPEIAHLDKPAGSFNRLVDHLAIQVGCAAPSPGPS